jgi:hypothetical protein
MKEFRSVGHVEGGDPVVLVPGSSDTVCTLKYALAARAVAEALFGWMLEGGR